MRCRCLFSAVERPAAYSVLLFGAVLSAFGGTDTTPPSIPASFSAIVNPACGRVDLSWSASTDPNGPSAGMGGYRIYRNGILLATNALVTTFADTGVSRGSIYAYRVSAVDQSGNESGQSSQASVQPCSDTTAPLVPAGFAPVVAGADQVNLTWQPASDSIGRQYESVSGIKSYQLFRNGTAPGNKIADLNHPANSFADTGLSPNTGYYYAIRVVDNANNVSAFSVSATVTTSFSLPGAPSGLTASANNCHVVQLDWSPPSTTGSGLAYYNVFRDGYWIAQTGIPSANDNNVAGGVSYTYTVTAVDTGGRESPASAPSVVQTPGCPAGPATNLKIDKAEKLAKVRWDGTPGALYQAQSAPGFFGPWSPVDIPTTELSVTNVIGQPSAIYRVALFTNTPTYLANYSVNIRDKHAPTLPLNLAITVVSENEAALAWDPVTDLATDVDGQSFLSGLDRYLIYRDGIFLKNEPASSTSTSDPTVEPDTEYTYSVAAVDKAGNRSGWTSNSILMRKPCNFNLSSSAASVGSGAGNGNFNITGNNGCGWAAVANAGWIHTSSSGSGGGTVSYAFDPNLGSARSGTITVGNKSFTVNQAALACSYALSPGSFSHGASAGNGSFAVTTLAGCSWSATTSQGWIHTFSGGNGNGSVDYSIDANPNTVARAGTIFAGGQSFTVNQAATAPALSLGEVVDNTSLNWTTGGDALWAGQTTTYFAGADAAKAGLIGNGQATWIETTINGPISLSFYWKVSSEGGFDVLRLTVDGAEQANTSGEVDWQQKSFSIPSGAHTVRWTYSKDGFCCAGGQDTAWLDKVELVSGACSYSLSAPSATAGSAGGPGGFSVTTGPSCNWAASPGASWIHTTSAGLGSGSVSYTVDANPNLTPRSGTITVGGQTFTINQNANQAPVANAGPDLSVSLAADASFSASGSSDFDGNLVSYQWDFGDGSGGSGFGVTHAYSFLGVYTVRLTVTDNLGASTSDTALITVVNLPDVIPPTVGLNVSGAPNVAGTVTLTASPNDNVGIAKVEFYRDGVLFSTATSTPYQRTFDTRTLSNGSHTFLAKAFDTSNNTNAAVVNVLVDNTAPSATLTAPANNSTVSGNITLSANASDTGSGISRVEFYYDAITIPCGSATSAPYSFALDTSALVNGSHTFYCKAFDAAGNSIVSAANSATINNTGPTPTGQALLERSFGGIGAGAGAITKASVIDRAGNLIIVGAMYYTVDFGRGSISSAGGQDAFVAKYNSSGQCLWSKCFGNVSSDVAYGVALDSADNILVTGSFSGPSYGGTLDFGTGPQDCKGGSDIFLLKLAGNGTHQWTKLFGGSGSDVGIGVAIDSSDNIVLTGTDAFFGTGADFGAGAVATYGQQDVVIAKLNSGGGYIWARSFGGSDSDLVTGIALDSAGNVVVVGQFRGSANFGNGTVSSAGDTDAYVAKYSGTDGGHQWFKRLGGVGAQSAAGVAVDPSGNIVLAGDFSGTVDFSGASATAEPGGSFYVVKYTSGGQYSWSKSYGAPDNGPHAAGISVDSSGRIVVAGEMTTGIDFGTGWLLGMGGNDTMVLKFAPGGSVLWAKRGSPYGNRGSAVTIDRSTGNAFVSGDCGASGVDFSALTVLATSGTANNSFFLQFAP